VVLAKVEGKSKEEAGGGINGKMDKGKRIKKVLTIHPFILFQVRQPVPCHPFPLIRCVPSKPVE